MPKKTFFSKFNKNDYNNILESVLEDKPFTADTKSLLLSMLYKIEDSYKDYSTVKRNVMKKNDFIEQIIGTIKYYCSSIKLVEPLTDAADEMRGSIVKVTQSQITAFPTEMAMVTAIAQIMPLDFPTNCLIQEEFQKILSEGYRASVIEVISDFDGWAWNISPITSRLLLYRNIEILLGHDFIEEWKVGRVGLQEVKERLNLLYNGENEAIISEQLIKVMYKGFVADFPEKAKAYLTDLHKLKEELNVLNNTSEYLRSISEQKKELTEKMKKIEKTLFNEESLKSEYAKVNAQLPLEKKFFSIRHYKIKLQEEKEQCILRLNECNKKADPAKILLKKDELKAKISQYEALENAMCETKGYDEMVIDFQHIFLKAWEASIEKATSKLKLLDLVYILRYYKNFMLDTYIKLLPELKESIAAFERALLLKLIDNEAVVKITSNRLYFIELLGRILDTDIIDFEEISFLPKNKDGGVVFEIYDGEILDSSVELGIDRSEVLLKVNKKVKLFE